MDAVHSAASTSRSRIRRGSFGWPASILVLIVLGLVGFRFVSSRSSDQRGVAQGTLVQRGPLRITVAARGNLKAADSVSLKSEVEGRTLILSLVPEGTSVKAGDVVCELDATALVEKGFQQRLSVSNAEASFVKARQNFEIQESQNQSDIASARQKLEFAQQDLRKYMEGERESELEKSREALTLTKEDSLRAADRLEWSQKLAAKGFITASELETDRVARDRVEIALRQATRELDLLVRFQVPRKEAELRAALEEVERERVRVELQAKARIIDFEADVRTNEAEFLLEKDKLAKIEGQIEKARIRAPRDGLIVYAQRDDDEPPVQEGTEVREREEIVTIPNAAGMIVQARLHESVLKQIEPGQPCTVQIDALSSQRFDGRVGFVALLPDQNSRWMNPSTRLYRTDIEITSGSEQMRPGMSCVCEILIEEIPDALYVPVQAVFRHRADTVSFVARGDSVETRTVRIGRQNEIWVQVLAGLKDGETVLLNPPPGFAADLDLPSSGVEVEPGPSSR